MIIEMDEESKKWIVSKGDQVTIKNLDVKACCAPGVQELIALPGKPKTLNHYSQITSDQVSFYIHKNVRKKGKVILTLSGIPFLKSLSVKLQ
ncbi:CC/Se motif family (seleno)protein [Bacillus sp. FJAT-27986]|uniref:CC/Se motif family (seleno)protein n=1 Tax=Bacillus sp. FJAT-27986 TaxID=1743146 RepID=UPI00080AE959|nr:CC/Se motif family (seleno)protein [Bacillus sp. FJAT-27986]OCA82569.1 Fe-S oxidoreductase [Bacillus sp. FJAT-27986]